MAGLAQILKYQYRNWYQHYRVQGIGIVASTYGIATSLILMSAIETKSTTQFIPMETSRMVTTVLFLCKGHPWDGIKVSTTGGCPLFKSSLINKHRFWSGIMVSITEECLFVGSSLLGGALYWYTIMPSYIYIQSIQLPHMTTFV